MITLKHWTAVFLCLTLLVICCDVLYYTKLRGGHATQTVIHPSPLNVSSLTMPENKSISVFIHGEVKMNGYEIPKKTLVWYDFYHNGHGLRNKGRHISFDVCSHKNCIRLPDAYVESPEDSASAKSVQYADAVIFQGMHYVNINLSIPRRNSQIYVFAEREPGYEIGCNGTYHDAKYENVFNWTMTFRRDSDVPMLYGAIINRNDDTTEMLTDEGKNAKKQSKATKPYNQIFSDKDLEVVWLVSHCETYSLREKYVAELQNYIQVDIIGACGNNTCPKKKSELCKAEIIKRYKFILSFENTFQEDYVTEKLFDWFPRDIIQVVFGLVDYSTVVPTHTVIDTNDFASPKLLAEYLREVGTNKEKYVSYLSTKDQYFAVGHTEMQQQAYCKLCELLNNVDSHMKTYQNIAEWWQRKNISRVNSFVAKNVTSLIDQLHYNE